MDIKSRRSELDITRIFALFTVISVHFFLNNGYYSYPVKGGRMLLMTIMRTAFMVCVPTFIMLTGYLMNQKSLSARYYRGITKTLVIYVLASLACLVYKLTVLKRELSPLNALSGIFNYTLANYSWYIEMYIGLFLLIPFLNILWNGLKSKKEKLWLCVTLMILTSLPSVFNIYNFTLEGWWRSPTLSNEYHQILPDWWTILYPLTYYFLGALLHDFPLRLKQRYKLILYLLSAVVFGLFNYYRSYGGNFAWRVYNDWYGLPTLITTLFAFAFFSSINTERLSNPIKRILKVISDLCLGAYLVSYIFDNLLYAELNRAVPEMLDRLYYYPLIVPAVFILSLALSGVLELIYRTPIILYKKRKELKNAER